MVLNSTTEPHAPTQHIIDQYLNFTERFFLSSQPHIISFVPPSSISSNQQQKSPLKSSSYFLLFSDAIIIFQVLHIAAVLGQYMWCPAMGKRKVRCFVVLQRHFLACSPKEACHFSSQSEPVIKPQVNLAAELHIISYERKQQPVQLAENNRKV